MAEIRRYPLVRHLRGDQSAQTLRYRRGRLVGRGRGLAFFFRPLTTAVAEVPLDDREVLFLFHARTADFQQATVQGTIAYRVVDAESLAERIDFTVDLDTGRWRRTPVDQLAGLLTQLAQQRAHHYLAHTPLLEAMRDGVAALRRELERGLDDETLLDGLGVEVAAVRVATVQPTAEMEKALQTPTRESIHQQADEATFARRALAVDKERAIAENELANRIELPIARSSSSCRRAPTTCGGRPSRPRRPPSPPGPGPTNAVSPLPRRLPSSRPSMPRRWPQNASASRRTTASNRRSSSAWWPRSWRPPSVRWTTCT